MRNKEEQAIESAGNADRAAKYQLKKKLKALPNYMAATDVAKEAMLQAAEEDLAEKRFSTNKSG